MKKYQCAICLIGTTKPIKEENGQVTCQPICHKKFIKLYKKKEANENEPVL
jgi:hypothetical protein